MTSTTDNALRRAFLHIAHMDVYTRDGEKPPHEVMRDIANEALTTPHPQWADDWRAGVEAAAKWHEDLAAKYEAAESFPEAFHHRKSADAIRNLQPPASVEATGAGREGPRPSAEWLVQEIIDKAEIMTTGKAGYLGHILKCAKALKGSFAYLRSAAPPNNPRTKMDIFELCDALEKENAQLRADLDTYIRDTEVEEDRIIDAEFAAHDQPGSPEREESIAIKALRHANIDLSVMLPVIEQHYGDVAHGIRQTLDLIDRALASLRTRPAPSVDSGNVQGFWREGIETAARWHDNCAEQWDAEPNRHRDLTDEQIAQCKKRASDHRANADAIRAICRPGDPGHRSGGDVAREAS